MTTNRTTAAEVVALQSQVDKIRTISVIAHVDHGKTTLVDSLLAAAGLLNKENAGQARIMQTKKEEQERGITIKSSGVSLVVPFNNEKYLIGLIDSPGHVDFSSEVTAALRLTDGALVVVDSVEGVGVQTATVLRQAFAERVKPILMVNKLDRAILELKLDPEALYQNLLRHVESVNALVLTYGRDDLTLDPLEGHVCFGSGKQGWAFSLPQMARFLAKRQGRPDAAAAVLKRMWGDHFWDDETRRFYNVPTSPSGKKLERYFCQVVLRPLVDLFTQIMGAPAGGDLPAALEKRLASLEVTLPLEKRSLRGQELMRFVMQRWLPAAEALIEAVVTHLPSPRQAQKYRVETLYTGPMDDECARAIAACDPEGPLVMYVSKMVPTPDLKRFIAFGRVLSGTLRVGQKVNILGPDYEGPGQQQQQQDGGASSSSSSSAKDLHLNKTVQRVVLMMGRQQESVDLCPAGNTIGIGGIDGFLVKTGTVTTSAQCWPIRPMKFSVSPVVRSAVEPKNPAQLPKLLEALKLLVKTDPGIHVFTSDAGEHIVAGAGELHLEVVLKDLQEMLGENVPLVISDPVVEFRETVSAVSSAPVLAKTINKLNRFYLTAQPLGEEFVKAIEDRTVNISAPMNDNERARLLVQDFQWDPNHARKIWFFGPEDMPHNVFVDQTTGLQYLNEVRDSVRGGLVVATHSGILCDEPMRGIRFNLVDAVLHTDANHRGGSQVIPAIRRALYGAQLSAKPRLLEPIFEVVVQATQEVVSSVYAVIGRRRGYVFAEEPDATTPNVVVKAYMPVAESFGFTSALREATSGLGFPSMSFHSWQIIDDDPFEADTQSNKFLAGIRKRKGLNAALPTLADYSDKL